MRGLLCTDTQVLRVPLVYYTCYSDHVVYEYFVLIFDSYADPLGLVLLTEDVTGSFDSIECQGTAFFRLKIYIYIKKFNTMNIFFN